MLDTLTKNSNILCSLLLISNHIKGILFNGKEIFPHINLRSIKWLCLLQILATKSHDTVIQKNIRIRVFYLKPFINKYMYVSG